MNKIICEIYRCSNKEGMYVYLARGDSLNQLPELLRKRAGNMELAMTLMITPEKKLARTKASEVLAAIKNQGFYLQMPPLAKIEIV